MSHNYEKLSEFCKTPRQLEVLESLINTNSQAKTSKAIGIHVNKVQELVRRVRQQAIDRGYDPQFHMVHPVSPGMGVARISTNYDGEGNVKQQWVIGKPDKEQQEEALRAFVEGLCDEIKPVKPSKYKAPKKASTELVSAVVIGDAHIGMIAHAVETMGEDVTLESSTADLRAAIDYLVECAVPSTDGWLINLGDWLHVASSHNTTHGGTAQDVSATFSQIFRAGSATLRYCIDKMLTKFETVTVVSALGNHDNDAAFAMGMVMEALYEKEPRVIIKQPEQKFHFLEWGKCLIGVHHGDKINANRLCGTMTRLASEAWGRTTFRRFYVGHIHHKTATEHDSGITLESFHTLAIQDKWHAQSGYGAEQRITMITLHKEFGEVSRMSPSLNLVRSCADTPPLAAPRQLHRTK